MSNKAKIIAFAGSTRKDSYNKKLVKIAAEGAREAGAEVTIIELEDYPLPLFDEDLEKSEGLPENGRKLKDLFLEHNGLLISSPEYNSSYSGVLKNTIDWLSRPVDGYPPLECFADKVAVLMAASPGSLGGLRGLVHVRSLLGNIKVTVLPNQIALISAFNAFENDMTLKDAKMHDRIKELGKKLTETINKLNS
ncbi:MAG: NAD(P)H-dependent oxidoreductase [candidate division Zixibacteria bacterium]|nr:NAD(P)H-dependent oxidoreductase [candidate division Zixibacteria bacterium]